ncbi:MAG TPA: ribbon-helix-helix protein, CopG family [bacterium]|nr:ribbon-helix-helix protein, CopG family [bacterium]
MKLSISLPDAMGGEIKGLAAKSERNVSWWIRRAWDIARTQLLRTDQAQRSHRRAMKKLASLTGVLKEDYPGIDSVTLSHQAFLLKKR